MRGADRGDRPDRPRARDRGGSSGLAAAKNLRDHGLQVDVVEREDDLGGNWNFGKPNSRVYESTHMISSKPFTQFPDFPMPDRDPTTSTTPRSWPTCAATPSTSGCST
jgi:cation diffusion facilitator CzcD-associated flavoprotein CzcO